MIAPIAVVGPTASGKSDLGIALARELGGEIVNVDSMQLYRGMDIGTAKLAPEERGGIPHHLLDIWPVTHTASVAEYQARAVETVGAIAARGSVPILVGGSMLYVQSLIDAWSFPPPTQPFAPAGRRGWRTSASTPSTRTSQRSTPRPPPSSRTRTRAAPFGRSRSSS